MENGMEAAIVHWDYIGIMENTMETTIVYWGYIVLSQCSRGLVISEFGSNSGAQGAVDVNASAFQLQTSASDFSIS